MDKDMQMQTNFALEHGKRTTDRMVEELLTAIAEQLINGKTIQCFGKELAIRQLGEVKHRESRNAISLIFDVVNPTPDFDHIEFMVIKTGWGRSL